MSPVFKCYEFSGQTGRQAEGLTAAALFAASAAMTREAKLPVMKPMLPLSGAPLVNYSSLNLDLAAPLH
jgi:hypothetical protein